MAQQVNHHYDEDNYHAADDVLARATLAHNVHVAALVAQLKTRDVRFMRSGHVIWARRWDLVTALMSANLPLYITIVGRMRNC